MTDAYTDATELLGAVSTPALTAEFPLRGKTVVLRGLPGHSFTRVGGMLAEAGMLDEDGEMDEDASTKEIMELLAKFGRGRDSIVFELCRWGVHRPALDDGQALALAEGLELGETMELFNVVLGLSSAGPDEVDDGAGGTVPLGKQS